jgi:hypothetical protein
MVLAPPVPNGQGYSIWQSTFSILAPWTPDYRAMCVRLPSSLIGSRAFALTVSVFLEAFFEEEFDRDGMTRVDGVPDGDEFPAEFPQLFQRAEVFLPLVAF